MSAPAGGRTSIDFKDLTDEIETFSKSVKDQITTIKGKSGGVSIGDMFDMQTQMNKLTQLTEMSTGVIAGINGAIGAINRNLKG
jgi:hypothetical protein